VGREHDAWAEAAEDFHEPFLVGQRARGDDLRRVPRAEPQRARLVVDREDADAGPSSDLIAESPLTKPTSTTDAGGSHGS
jgi:hypothetical protein